MVLKIVSLEKSLKNVVQLSVLVPISSDTQEELRHTIWFAFFAILVLLFCLEVKRSVNANKSKRESLNVISQSSPRSPSSSTTNFHPQEQSTILPQNNDNEQRETSINLQVADANSTAVTAGQELRPPQPDPATEDPPPGYEVPPSYEDCA